MEANEEAVKEVEKTFEVVEKTPMMRTLGNCRGFWQDKVRRLPLQCWTCRHLKSRPLLQTFINF